MSASVLTIPSGNYTASNLASALQSVLQARYPNENYTCVYNTSRGSVSISFVRAFIIFTDDQVVQSTNSIGFQFPGWVDHTNQPTTVDIRKQFNVNK